ncbi:bacteriocin [Vibrio sp. 2175-1]|uniref:YMGG-like glycine zipper-containing protein n=1 Tax=Vibrio TaxID=662 RepID=UPI001CDCBCD0|nr:MULTISPECIES: YMGG-like glycine zipper-containing protein [Vibrio]MCA2497768.1 bacteriocin [Vibrio alginolyticus]MDW2217455.1 bacteriocin [Vibrio sp. 2175-1]
MGYSLLQLGADTRKQALAGLESSASREEQRDQLEQNLKDAAKAKKLNSVTMGAGMGMAMGAQVGSVGGPMGAAIGAAAGLVLGELF